MNTLLTALPEPGQLTPDGHAQISRRFLAQARIHLDEHDRLQAAEKIWGAAAHALKAIGEQRGWDHSSLSNIFAIGEHLGREFGREWEFSGCMAQAGYVRVDFYGNGWSEDTLELILSAVTDFVAELEVIRNSPPRPYTVGNDSDRIRLGHLLGRRRSERPNIGDYSPVGYSLALGVDKE